MRALQLRLQKLLQEKEELREGNIADHWCKQVATNYEKVLKAGTLR